jgi:ribosomal protein S18 acetylase RimI-like enzyme
LQIFSDIRGVLDLLQIAFCQGGSPNPDTLRELKMMRRMIPLLTFSAWLGDDLEGIFSGFVWEKEGVVVGNVSVHRSSDGAGSWLVSNLAVHPHHRGEGIARRLMIAAKERVVERGGTSIILKARKGNIPAARLYAAMGFQRIWREARMTKPPGAVPPASVDSPSQVRRATAQDSRAISASRGRAVVAGVKLGHLLVGSGSRSPLGFPALHRLRDALALRRRQAWVAERPGALLAYLEMTANRIPPFQRGMAIFPAPQCRSSDVQSLAAKALWTMGAPAKSEVTLSLQELGEQELERDLDRLGFIESSVEDTLYLNLRHQEKEEVRA